MKKIETWLPVFSGFYNTIWEPQTDTEIAYINERRNEGGFAPIGYNDCEWDYSGYQERVAEGVTKRVGAATIDAGLIQAIEYQRIKSPKEYNFRNDSIDVVVTLTRGNEKAILSFLKVNETTFSAYLKEVYTSYSGFISHYPNIIAPFMADSPLNDKHKLGAILNFCCGVVQVDEMTIYEDLTGNGVTLEASNYSALIAGIEPVKE